MLSISHNPVAQPATDRCPVSDYPARVSSAPVSRYFPATPESRTTAKPAGFGNSTEPVALMAMLKDLFTQFFNQLQVLLRKDVRPADTTNNDLPVPQPRVQPTSDKTLIDKQSEPIPELSTKRNGEKPNNVWNGFRQGRNGNCVTISAIKAAMAKFGQNPKDIYKSVEKVADAYKVVMRDGFELTLKKSELHSSIRGSNFVALKDNEMLKDAHFLYACSAKRAQIENNDGSAKRSFDAAIRSLNDGEDERGPGEGFKRLGLKDHMKRVSASAFADESLIGMVNRRGHSVAVVDGREEDYGKKGNRPRDGQAIALVG